MGDIGPSPAPRGVMKVIVGFNPKAQQYFENKIMPRVMTPEKWKEFREERVVKPRARKAGSRIVG
jgi:hypothetical protein